MTLVLVEPAQPETHPQGLLLPFERADAEPHAPTDHPDHETVRALLAAVAPVTDVAWCATLALHLGYDYGFLDRCIGDRHEHDCSGYQCWGGNQFGLGFGCTDSFHLAQLCHALGLGIPLNAPVTGVEWAFHGANEGQTSNGAPNGSDGHIVTVVPPDPTGRFGGDPAVPSTMEAMGHAYGVVRGTFYGRGWTYRSRIPGVVPMSLTHGERDVYVQTWHYDLGTGKQTVPTHSPVDGQDPTVVIAQDGSCLEARYGASLANDQLDASSGQMHLRRLTPVGLGAHKLVAGPTFRPPDVDDPHPGLVVQDDAGVTHRVHLS